MHYPYSDKTEVLNNNEALGYLLASTRHNDFVELHIQKSGFVPPHALPIDVSFYIVEGSGEISIEDKSIQAQQGDMVHVDKNLQRSWRNTSDALLRLLVIKQK